MAQGDISPKQLIEQADELQDEKAALLERIGANREILRNLRKAGLLSDAQAQEVEEVYPTVERKRKSDDDAE